MKAIAFSEFGGPEVLRTVELDRPEPGPGQVRVAVRAAGYNPIDAKIRSGAFGDPARGFPAVPGVDFAGVVDAVGEAAGFAIGDEVVGWAATGSYAEYALATTVTRKPAQLDWVSATALPVGTEAAYRILRKVGVTDGDCLLVHGAAGLVGAYAVQLAARLGAQVIGTAGPADHDYVRALGAIPVAYGDGWADRVRAVALDGVDAVVDTTGAGVLPDSIALLGSTDRLVTIADSAAFSLGVTFSGGPSEVQYFDTLGEFVELAADGSLVVTVSKTFPLEQAAAAHEYAQGRHSPGKIVLVP